MNQLPFRFLLISLLCLGLSGCYSSVCGYVWNRALAAEATWIPNPDRAELYRAGDDIYAKALRGKVRGAQDGCLHDIIINPSRATWVPVSEENETVYLKVKLKVRSDNGERPHLYSIEPDRSSLLTRLPESATAMQGPGVLPRVKTAERFRKLREPVPCTEPQTDAHALYAYPLGLATAVAVDVPCSVLLNAGALVGSIFYTSYQLID